MDFARKEPSQALLDGIKRQVEFYFGDANMKRDKFFIEQTKLDDGWISMTIMLRCRLLASMSRDVEVILRALESSDLIEISADRTKIRRSPREAVPGDLGMYSKTAQKARTVYVQGFSRESDTKKLIDYFEIAYPVEHIFLKKDKLVNGITYEFNGSLFLQFKTMYDAQKFMGEYTTKYEDKVLTKSWAPESYTVGSV